MNLFLPIFVIFLGRAGQFTCLLLVLLVQCLMLFWCRELWKESQKKKIKNMLFKRCHTTCLSTASNAPRMPQFLFSLQVLHIHVMERIACLVKDIWCCPCIYWLAANISKEALHLDFNISKKKTFTFCLFYIYMYTRFLSKIESGPNWDSFFALHFFLKIIIFSQWPTKHRDTKTNQKY
jgi:hypothetical protein